MLRGIVTPVKERRDFGFFESCLYVNMKCVKLFLALDLAVKEFV